VPGMLATAGAMLMFAIMNAFAKYLSTSHSVLEIAFYRNVFACLPFLAVVFLFGQRDILVIRTKPQLVITRAILGTVSLALTFAAYSRMPMAETSALLFTASLFLPVLGVVLLREQVGLYRWSAVAAGFVGVAIMANPSGAITLPGLGFALAAALMQAFLGVILRHLGGFERPETIAFYFFIIGTLVTAAAMPFVARPFDVAELPLWLGVGLSGAAAQWFYSVALKLTPAAIVAVLNYTSLVWAMLIGWLVWGDWPTTLVFTGAVIVITSSLFIAWRERRARLAKSHHTN
jgi:drug/metabolite transporter (DMT)-like permease